MIQKFDFDGTIVEYDTDSPRVTHHKCGNARVTIIQPEASYEELYNWIKAVRGVCSEILGNYVRRQQARQGDEE